MKDFDPKLGIGPEAIGTNRTGRQALGRAAP